MLQYILYPIYFILLTLFVLIMSPVVIYVIVNSYYSCYNYKTILNNPKQTIEPIVLATR